MNGESVNGTRNSVEALVADAGSEIGTALAAIGVGVNIISGLLDDERVNVTDAGWQQVARLVFNELPDLGKLHELRRLCAVLSGDYVPGADGGRMRAEDFGDSAALDEEAPDIKVWTRKLSTGVRTYRWVPAAELDAYLAGIGADPDREVAADAPGDR